MIKQLDLVNFGGHTARYTFGARKHLIKGKNEAGKSSIAKAIAFNMMGVDTEGNKNPDHLISVGQDGVEVSLSTAKATIKRTKRRGATSKIKLIREGVPNVDMNQTDLMNQVGLSLDVFMSCWLAGYFMKLPATSRLKVLGEIANIDRKELLLSLLPDGYQIPAQVKLINPKIDADAIAGIRRQEQNKRAAAEGSLNTLVASQGASLGMTEEQYNNALIRLAEVTAAIEAHDLYQKQAVAFANETEKLKENKKATDELIANLQKASGKHDELLQNVAATKQELEFTQKQKQEFVAKANSLEKNKQKLELSPPQKPTATGGNCPTCKQDITAEHISKVQAKYESDLNDYNNASRKVADHNKKIDDELTILRDGYKNADIKATELTGKLNYAERDLQNLESVINQLHQAAETTKSSGKAKLVSPPVPPQGDFAQLKSERDDLAGGTRAYQQILAKQGQDAAQIESLKQSIIQLDNVIVRYSALEKTLLDLPAIETQQTLEKVSIPGVDLSLVENELIVKDAKEVDYRSLSDGRRMKIDIALATAIRRATGPRAPQLLFVDNADLMDSQLEIPDDVQVLIAHVDNNVDGVQVVEL